MRRSRPQSVPRCSRRALPVRREPWSEVAQLPLPCCSGARRGVGRPRAAVVPTPVAQGTTQAIPFLRAVESRLRLTSGLRVRSVLTVGGGQLAADPSQAVAQLRRVDDLDGGAEPGDLAGERIDVVASKFDRHPTVCLGGPDADTVAEDPATERDDFG